MSLFQQAHHDRVLALEVVVERRLREPERAGDVPDRGPFKALLGEQRERDPKDLRPRLGTDAPLVPLIHRRTSILASILRLRPF